MTAVALLARKAAGRNVARLGILGLVTVAALGFVLTAATGAQRVSTSWARLLARTKAPDAVVSVPYGDVDAAFAFLGARDDIEAMAAMVWLPASAVGLAPGEAGTFAGLGPGFGTSVFRSVLIRGRAADPARADEVTFNESLAIATGVDVDGRTTLVGPGVDQAVTVVGIHRSPIDIVNGGAPSAMGTPAFGDHWSPAVARVTGEEEQRPAIALRLAAGVDPDAALAEIGRGLPGAAIIGPDEFDADVSDGLHVETTSYVVLAVFSGLASLALIALLAGRAMSSEADDARTLSGVGAVRWQRALTVWLPPAAAIVAGAAVAPAAAIVASPWVRTGFARVADPAPGIWFDGWLLVAIAGGMAAVLLLGTAAAAWRVVVPGPRRDAAVRHPSRVAARLGSSAPAAVGLATAAGGSRASTRRQARSTVAAITLAATCLVAAVAWRASADHLAQDFRLQGWDFDAYLEPTGEPGPAVDDLGDVLLASPGLTGLTAYQRFPLALAGTEVDVLALTDLSGAVHPTLVRGRAPVGPAEITLGSTVMRRLGIGVGDHLDLPGVSGPVPVTVVGEAVYPLVGNAGFGNTASVPGSLVEDLTTSPLASGFLADFSGAGSRDAVLAGLGDGVTVLTPSSPPAVERLQRAASIVDSLVLFLAVFAALALGAGAVVAGHRELRHYAVLRSLGFRRRDVRAAVTWNTAWTCAIAAVVALPLGVAAGRTAWRLSARNLGVLVPFVLPAVTLAAIVGAAAVAVAVIAAGVSRHPAHAPLAALLRTE